MEKVLMLGFDGGDAEIFRIFDMPFLNSLMESGVELEIKEDLLTRGWSEIMTGRKAQDTGGLYFRPNIAEHRPLLSDKYNLRDMTKNPEVTPLWEMLNQKGVSIGMMGVPTTSPAPVVDGFAVSGGGGGKDKIEGIPEGYCYPKIVGSKLVEVGYIFDVRLSSCGIDKTVSFIDAIEEVNSKTAACYIRLADDYAPSFNFLVFRPTTGIQYLARYDIEDVKNRLQAGKQPGAIGQRLMEHYKALDDSVRQIFEAIGPDRYLLVADHGTACYRRRLNINALLEKHGLYHVRSGTSGVIRTILKQARTILPKSFRSKYSGRITAVIPGIVASFDMDRTSAFGHYLVPGVYINDEERFGGPVPRQGYDELVEKICLLIDDEPTLASLGVKAVPYRREFAGSYYEKELPDIRITGPDTHFFVNKGGIVADNENFRPTPEILDNVHNPFSGIKGSRPLLCVDTDTAKLMKSGDPKDLTLAYRLVDRLYKDS